MSTNHTQKVTVIFHSGSGHTERMAEAVAAGARDFPGTAVSLIPVAQVESNWAVIDASDAIIFGCPTYMGGASAQFKAFIDSTSKHFMTRAWSGKIAGGFTVSASQSGDKLNTLVQLGICAAQLGMIWVGVDILPGNNNSQGSQDDLNRLGSEFGAMAQANFDQGPEGMRESDLKTGAHLGTRVARIASQLKAGRTHGD
jgi:multimeric flavodoxin WrbA